MAELTVEQRLEKLEKLAHITCWRCLKEIPFNEAKFVVWPGDENEIALCSDCKYDYDLTENSAHYRYECALKDCLKEIRLQKK